VTGGDDVVTKKTQVGSSTDVGSLGVGSVTNLDAPARWLEDVR